MAESTNFVSKNNSKSDGSTSANMTSDETYKECAERKVAEYEKEDKANNNSLGDYVRNGNHKPTTDSIPLKKSQHEKNTNTDIVTSGIGINNGDAVSKDRPSSVSASQSSVASLQIPPNESGTYVARVRDAILHDKGVDSRAAYLANADESQRENRPGVFLEDGLGPGSVPVWAQHNPSPSLPGPPREPAVSEASVIPIDSTRGQTEESLTNLNTSTFKGTDPKISWCCRKRVLVTVSMLLIVAISLSVILLFLSDGKSENASSDVLKLLSDASNLTLIQQIGTPQQLAFDWIVEEDRLSSPQNTEKLKSRYALAVLYFATSGESLWVRKDNWLDGEVNECEWEFLTCSESVITKIDMRYQMNDDKYRGNGLVGTLPWEDLAMLTSLGMLKVSKSKISGTIDPSISSFTDLRVLDLQYNDLSGTIPDELFELSTLEKLSLYFNTFTGTIPETVHDLTSLRILDLQYNDLSGSIPDELFELSTLEILDLGKNDLDGSVSTLIGQLSNLVYLGMQSNRFTGAIPETLYDLTSLELLRVNNNIMSSSISTEIGLMTSLKLLKLDGNSMTSSLPTEIGLLTQLSAFGFRFTDITGTIPKDVCALKETFDLERLCCNKEIADESSCCSEECTRK